MPVKPGTASLISMASNKIQHDQAGGVIQAHQNRRPVCYELAWVKATPGEETWIRSPDKQLRQA